MTEHLFEFLTDPEPLSLPSMLVGNTVLLVVGGMTLFALLAMPMIRGLAVMVGGARWLVDRLLRFVSPSRSFGIEPDRPLDVAGLSPGLANLARQTRTLALELRRRSEEARHWPEDAGELEPVRVRWWSSFVSDAIDFSPLLDTRRDVYDWLSSVEGLGVGDRGRLAELGIDAEAVRAALTAEQAVAERVRALAGLLWSIDERLAGATSAGYRSSGAERGVLGRIPGRWDLGEGEGDDADADEELARRRRFARLISTHGRSFSRMAADYAKSPAEREDLEQDIALALWQALPSFRGESSVETFAYRIARYCCYRHVRRRGRLQADDEAIAAAGDPDACLEAALLRADVRAQIEQARASLPDSLASTLSLHLSGLSYAEIAERLGISEQNVSVRLTRARTKLRDRLAAA